MTQSLNCPNCGAPSADDAANCEYCGSALATMACTSCMGSMFIGSQFCPHCGTKVADAETVDASTLVCPGCTADMTNVRLGGTPMYQCAKCGSMWVAPDAFTKLCADHESRAVFVKAIGGDAPPPSVRKPGAVRYVPCPACKKTMNRVNFGRTSGVVIDVCKNHGVWFERDELREVLAFVEAGGLERLHDDQSVQQLVREKALGFSATATSADNVADLMIRINISANDSSQSPLRALLGALFS